jgi:hypothetical protein
MARTEAIAAVLNRNPRLARTLGWALLGGVTGWLAFYAPVWVSSWNLQIQPVGEFMFALVIGLLWFVIGLPYSGAVGFMLWRGNHANWGRAAGFALLAAFWFFFGVYAGEIATGWDLRPFEYLDDFVIYFAGFLTASAWVTLAGLLLLPALRSRRAAAWMLGIGAVFAVLVGAFAVVDASDVVDALNYLLAAWGASQAAAISLALPPTRRSAKQPER